MRKGALATRRRAEPCQVKEGHKGGTVIKWYQTGCYGLHLRSRERAPNPNLQPPSLNPTPSHTAPGYLLLFHAAKGLTDELDILARERGQLAVARAQIHVLGGRNKSTSAHEPP